MSYQYLSSLVAIYHRKHGTKLADYLDYFRKLKPFDDAIRYACHGKCGNIHDHQRRVGKVILEQARKVLQKHAGEIKVCKSFDDLLTLVADCTNGIERFGVLAVYDTSLRLGAHLNRWPKVVYVHAGTKKGCKALGVQTTGGKVEREDLPKPLQKLEPYHAENFLCIFKDEFGEPGGRVKGCGPDGRGEC